MRSTLASLQRDIRDMRAMTSAIAPASAILATSSNANIREYLAVRRRFDYSALIVALYAAYETFVEELLNSYVAMISQYTAYGALPQGLRDKHLQRTGELLAKRELDQARYPGIKAQNLVDNLYGCLSGKQPYVLNHYAVSAHDANLRANELVRILNLVEIEPSMVRRDRDFIAWYFEDQKMQGDQPDIIPETVIKQRLDELVGRRNDVAHRGGNPDDRLGVDEMRQLVDFVAALSQSIFASFVTQYFRQRHVGSDNCSQLTVVQGPWKKKHVRIVERPPTKLYVGQPAFALSSAGLARWGRVRSLQVSGVDQTEIDPGSNGLVGVETDFPAPQGMDVFTLDAEDDSIWDPLKSSG